MKSGIIKWNNHHHGCGSTNDHSMSREDFEDVSRSREFKGGEMFNRAGIWEGKKKKRGIIKKTDIC